MNNFGSTGRPPGEGWILIFKTFSCLAFLEWFYHSDWKQCLGRAFEFGMAALEWHFDACKCFGYAGGILVICMAALCGLRIVCGTEFKTLDHDRPLKVARLVGWFQSRFRSHFGVDLQDMTPSKEGSFDSLKGCRIGEASNPGPMCSNVFHGRDGRFVSTPA